jgi:hypothetical protein
MKYAFLIALLAFFTSCKKGAAEFTIKGTLHDQTFNQPLGGAKIKLYQVPVGTTQMKLVSTTTTSSDGTYSFTFTRDKMEKYILEITKNNYFTLSETVYFKDLSIKDDNIYNYSATALSWIKMTFHDNNPQTGHDLHYIKQEGKQGCSECCGIEEKSILNKPDTSIYCINDGNTPYSIYYWLVGNPAIQGTAYISTAAFDTTEIIINY